MRPGEQIKPYDFQVTDLTESQHGALVRRLKSQLAEFAIGSHQNITSLCYKNYNDLLRDAGLGITSAPIESYSGHQAVAWLRSRTDPLHSEAELNATYTALHPLFEGNRLRSLKDAIEGDLSESGVYLFLDPAERRLTNPSALRIVRVGTHGVAAGSKATLRDRLRTHLGSSNGGGNHRSSVFRLHVGRALLKQKGANAIPTWGSPAFPTTKRQQRIEALHEKTVSNYIGNLLVTVIDVPGDSSKSNDRAYLEQNIIAILSNAYRPLDPPSFAWLGSSSDKADIRKSGLWNVNHTAQGYQANYLSVLRYYVALTVGDPNIGSKPQIGPDWTTQVRRDTRQIDLI